MTPRPHLKVAPRHVAGLVFLALQIGAILQARFIPERFFCWAPFDEHSYFRIEVEVAGRRLSRAEVEARYRYRAEGWEPRSIHNVISIVRQYESSYGRGSDARVTIRYVVNGHPEETWTWPNQ
jgi:hypothetical protein